MIFVRQNLQRILAQKFFGQVWGNSGKNPSLPKNMPAPTPNHITSLGNQGGEEFSEGGQNFLNYVQ